MLTGNDMIQQITKSKDGWLVPSRFGDETYRVTLKNDKPTCTCIDFGVHGIKCRHINAVEALLRKRIYNEKNTSKPARFTYSQCWSSYNQAQTKEKEIFQKLLYDLCDSIPNPEYTFGRPKLALSDMIFASALKVYSTFSLRRFITDMKEANENGYCKVCSYSTVSNYMRSKELTPILIELIQKLSLPFKSIETKFAIDSSGFSTCRFDRWFSAKYGKNIDKRSWIKAHLINGVKTHIVTGIKITKSCSNDIKEFPNLLTKTAKTFQIDEVMADKAYSSRDTLSLVNRLGGTPYIPFKKRTTGRSRGRYGSKLWNKLFYYFMYNNDEFQQHYHKRSNAETVFSMIKRKFGDSVRSKEWTSQINEVLLKVLCHNICVMIQEMYELNIEPKFKELNLDFWQ